MTDQISDTLRNSNAHVSFGDLRPYRVSRSDPRKLFAWHRDYSFQTKPEPHSLGTGCYRGYVADFELTAEGQLILRSYSYPSPLHRKNPERTLVNETLVGSFWLVMRTHCFGPEVYVPFHNGKIICDESRWGVCSGPSVTAIKYPQRYRWFIEEVLPPVFLGEVREAQVNESNDEEIVVVCSKPIPREYWFCRVRIVRANREICEEQITGSAGGPADPWLMNRPDGAIIQSGDQLWATGRNRRELIAEGVPR